MSFGTQLELAFWRIRHSNAGKYRRKAIEGYWSPGLLGGTCGTHYESEAEDT
jgi:hypothetical protein